MRRDLGDRPEVADARPELTAEQIAAVSRREEPLLLSAAPAAARRRCSSSASSRRCCEDGIRPGSGARDHVHRARRRRAARARARAAARARTARGRRGTPRRRFVGTFHGFCARLLRVAPAAGRARTPTSRPRRAASRRLAAPPRVRRRRSARSLPAGRPQSTCSRPTASTSPCEDSRPIYAELRSRGQRRAAAALARAAAGTTARRPTRWRRSLSSTSCWQRLRRRATRR